MDRKRREYSAGGGFQSAEQSTDAASWLKSNGEIISGTREEMKAKADELNSRMSANCFYSVKEME